MDDGGRDNRGPDPEGLDAVTRPLVELFRLGASRKVHARQAAVAGVAVSQPGLVLLGRLLDAGPLPLTELAAHADMDPGAASRQVKALEADGLVARRARPGDGRVSEIVLTEGGRRARRAVAAVQDRHMADVLAGWSPADRAAFATLLDRFVTDLRAVRLRPADQPRRSA